jgi:hypothetical protein
MDEQPIALFPSDPGVSVRLAISPPSLQIPVRYWSDKDRAVIRRLSAGPTFDAIVRDGLRCSYGDFLSYAVFHEQSDDPGFETWEALQQHAKEIQGTFELHYGEAEGTIRGTRRHDEDSRKKETEVAGIGIGLAVASDAYGLHQADWQRIEESPKEKTLDYRLRLASDGRRFVEVEVKGRRVDEPSAKDGLYGAAADIRKKKAVQLCADRARFRNVEPKKRHAVAAVERLGTVCALPGPDASKAVCYLVDPPPDLVAMDPLQYRLLARLTYYWKAIGAISRSPFVAELRDRIDFIRYATNWRSFDGRPLLDRTGAEQAFPQSYRLTKVRPESVSVFGELIRVARGKLFYYGFDDEVVNMLLRQRFEEIVAFSSDLETRIQGQEVEVAIPSVPGRRERRRPRRALARLFASRDGRVFGLAQPMEPRR